ncbi:MAG: hypothetical protein QME46_09215 [Thermoanaerobacteraceae bacterium]|nr:hypothetical protein [Thermoanaerobacteraceae bacterium]
MAEVKKNEPIKKKYKTQGMVVFWIAAWIDFVLLYFSAMNGNNAMMTAGFILMLIIGGIAYYFG